MPDRHPLLVLRAAISRLQQHAPPGCHALQFDCNNTMRTPQAETLYHYGFGEDGGAIRYLISSVAAGASRRVEPFLVSKPRAFAAFLFAR